MIERIKQVLGKLETTEGTWEAVAVADGGVLPYEPVYSVDPEQFSRDAVRDTLSRLGNITGKRPAGVSFRSELRGSGNHVTTAPPFGKYLVAADFYEDTLNTLGIGAVTSGPFQAGEKITGGTSAAEGICVKQASDGDSVIYIVVTTGTFQSAETITGTDSGASATTSTAAVDVGICYRPRPIRECSVVTSMSLEVPKAGPCDNALLERMKGARSNAIFDFVVGEPVMITHDFAGVFVTPVDGNLYDDIDYGTTKPPAFLNANFSVAAYAAIISSMNLNLNNVLSFRTDANDTHGGKSVWIVDRNPEGTYDPELTLKANHDFFGNMVNDTEMYIETTVGSTVGNKFIFAISKAQYRSMPQGDREQVSVVNPTFGLNSKNLDAEMFLLCL